MNSLIFISGFEGMLSGKLRVGYPRIPKERVLPLRVGGLTTEASEAVHILIGDTPGETGIF